MPAHRLQEDTWDIYRETHLHVAVCFQEIAIALCIISILECHNAVPQL